jgi:hypothetical protein
MKVLLLLLLMMMMLMTMVMPVMLMILVCGFYSCSELQTPLVGIMSI